MIDNFPLEILYEIISFVPRNQLPSLNRVNKKFNHLITPKLYNYIEVNCCKFETNDNAITITNVYNLKSLLKKLTNPQYSKHVYSLIFKKLPDMPEDEIFQYFIMIFPNLVNLSEFKWYSNYNLDLKLINLLPPEKLYILNGNFKNFQLLNYNFKNIKSLSLSGFQNFHNVNINLKNFPYLEKLKISKKNLIHIEDPLINVFNNDHKLILTHLTLENLFITKNEVELITNKINFTSITDFKLINCYEILNQNDEHQGGNFLRRIDANHLQHLQLDLLNNEDNNQYIFNFLSLNTDLTNLKITLNIANDLQANLIKLLSTLPHNNLQQLDLNFNIISHNKLSMLNYLNPLQLIKMIANFKCLTVLKLPIFYRNLCQFHLSLPNLEVLQFNIIDVVKYNSTLINYEVNDVSVKLFNHILSHISSHLQYLIINLDQFHVFNVQQQLINITSAI